MGEGRGSGKIAGLPKNGEEATLTSICVIPNLFAQHEKRQIVAESVVGHGHLSNYYCKK